MEALKEILAKLHYLNHPYLSGIGALCCLLIATFVLFKNPKSPSYRAFFWMLFVCFIWFFGNTLSMFYFQNLEASIFGYRFGYTGVCFMGALYYNFYLAQSQKKKKIIHLFYAISILEVLYLWFSNDVKISAYALFNVGVVWKGFPIFSYFLTFGMIKYTTITLFTTFSFMQEYKREAIPLKKKQLKFLTILFLSLSMGWIEWLVGFDIPLHIAWLIIPTFTSIFAYAIIHYKAMEIDTVIHRTILWLTSILLLVVPAGVMNVILIKFFPAVKISVSAILSCIYLIIFVFYYNRLRPRIDHLFRRRKYDYQTILGKVAEKIAISINIVELTKNLLTEVCEAMYLRNSLLYIVAKDTKRFLLTGRRGYQEVNMVRQLTSLEIFTEEERVVLPESQRELVCSVSSFCKWLVDHQDVLEKEQVEVDPQYEPIKQSALAWFSDNEVELIVPLVLENQVHALLGLGKKENLQAYTLKDIDLLHKLGQEAGVTVFNALHYEDLAEKERLEEEMRMGRQIQMALLPHVTPRIPGLTVQGLMQPAREIGGDYYDFITLPERDSLSIVIGDVSGKGVAAGLFMAMAKTAIHTLSQEETSPRQILLRTNHILHQHIAGQKFMTMLYLKWQSNNQTLTYSSAGHEHILIYRTQSQSLEAIQSGGLMLGMLPDIETYLEEKQIQLKAQDKVLLYTDGVTEAQNQQGERFSLARLKEAFTRHSQKSAEVLMQAIKDEVYAFAGNVPQYDDITLVVMEAC